MAVKIHHAVTSCGHHRDTLRELPDCVIVKKLCFLTIC